MGIMVCGSRDSNRIILAGGPILVVYKKGDPPGNTKKKGLGRTGEVMCRYVI